MKRVTSRHFAFLVMLKFDKSSEEQEGERDAKNSVAVKINFERSMNFENS